MKHEHGIFLGKMPDITNPVDLIDGMEIEIRRMLTSLALIRKKLIDGQHNGVIPYDIVIDDYPCLVTDTERVIGDLVVYPARNTALWKGVEVELTTLHYSIVECLSHRVGVVRSRAYLLDEFWPMNEEVDDRNVDSHIKRIRQAFKAVDPDFNQIRTHYKLGYSWRSK